ncbi:hypothetical protein IFR05_014252, partial [Cadophora sp. M221]
MPPATPPLDFDHQKGDEIPTKHKEAIRQLYGFAKVPIEVLMTRYKLGKSTITKILNYDAPERARISRTGRPSLLTDTQVDEIIEYLSESWNNRSWTKSAFTTSYNWSKNGAFKQADYLAQVLAPYIEGILEAFAEVTHQLRPSAEPLFMEDGNAAHGHKSTRNCCTRYRTAHGIILMLHPSTSPDMNPIEKCWRIKQALHRRRRQPTTEVEMEVMVLEEWDRIPQEWIN